MFLYVSLQKSVRKNIIITRTVAITVHAEVNATFFVLVLIANLC